MEQMVDLPFGEDMNYWKTSTSAPDTWMDRTKKQLKKVGGQVLAEGYGSESVTGRAAFMLGFELQGDRFKVVWPVLPTRGGDERAARRQAVTMLYHHVKAACVSAQVLGARTAFFSFLLLPDGRVAAEASVPELMESIPEMLAGTALPPPEDDTYAL